MPTPTAAVALPTEPLIRIRPASRGLTLDVTEWWANRELFSFLVWRDIKVRYKQTALGVGWAVLQPLFTMLVFTLFFGKLARLDSEGIAYPLFALAGLLPWTYFSNAVNGACQSLVNNTSLVTKVYFPRVLIPAATVGAGLLDFAIGFVLLGGLLLGYQVPLNWQLLWLPLLAGLTALLALAVGIWLASLNVKYRDIRYALPFLIQLLMFATPIIYPARLVPERWRWLLQLNPLTGIIEAFRAALFHRPMPWNALAFTLVITALLLPVALFSFRRTEAQLADLI